MQTPAHSAEAQKARSRRYFAYNQWYAAASRKMISRRYLARYYATELRQVWEHQGKSPAWIAEQLRQN